MDIQTASVQHRLAELRRLGAVLRLERTRRGHVLTPFRIALGRRLVALGAALLDGTGGRPATAPR